MKTNKIILGMLGLTLAGQLTFAVTATTAVTTNITTLMSKIDTSMLPAGVSAAQFEISLKQISKSGNASLLNSALEAAIKVANKSKNQELVTLMVMGIVNSSQIATINQESKGNRIVLKATPEQTKAIAQKLRSTFNGMSLSDEQVAEIASAHLTMFSGEGLNAAAKWSQTEQENFTKFLSKYRENLSRGKEQVEAFYNAALEYNQGDQAKALDMLKKIVDLCGAELA